MWWGLNFSTSFRNHLNQFYFSILEKSRWSDTQTEGMLYMVWHVWFKETIRNMYVCQVFSSWVLMLSGCGWYGDCWMPACVQVWGLPKWCHGPSRCILTKKAIICFFWTVHIPVVEMINLRFGRRDWYIIFHCAYQEQVDAKYDFVFFLPCYSKVYITGSDTASETGEVILSSLINKW